MAELDGLPVADSARTRLARAIETGGLSGRGWDRLRRVARTIADLDGEEVVSLAHVEEAIELRQAA